MAANQSQIAESSAKNLIAHRLEYLAPEIWTQIFEWACRDSGATGRSLGLTNRDFRRMSRPYAYQSIHLPRAKDIFAFRELLSTLPADQKRVRFLHTPCPHIFMNAFPVDDDFYFSDEDEFEEDGEYQKAKEEPEESEILRREAFRDILNQVSSSLLVLSVYWNSKVAVLLEELLVPLPRLEELHIHRRFVDTRPHPQTIRPPMFSNLLRLHIAGQYSEEGSISFNDFLGQAAPRLTHLFVPGFYLRSIKSKLQDSLHVVVVDLGPSIIYGSRGSPHSYDNVATIVFGSHPPEGKTLTLINDDDTEWSENSEGWEARWKISNAGRNRPPWLTW